MRARRKETNRKESVTNLKGRFVMNKSLRVIVLLVIVGFFSTFALQSSVMFSQNKKEDPVNQTYIPLVSSGEEESEEVTTVGFTEENLGNGWIKYTDNDLGFSIEYPEEWYKVGHSVDHNDRCFASEPGEVLFKSPIFCVDYEPRVKTANGVTTNPVIAFEYLSKTMLESVTPASITGFVDITTKQYDVDGFQAVERLSAAGAGSDTEPHYTVNNYVLVANDTLVRLAMGTHTLDEYSSFKSLLEHMLTSFKIL
jgi:hypothetical protein